MEYIIIGIFVIFATICLTLFLKKKKDQESKVTSVAMDASTSKALKMKEDSLHKLEIQMEMLPVEAIADESKLVEITNSKVLAHVNNLIPGLAQAGNSANNAVQAVQANREVLYRAIIPAGAKLTNSSAMENAVRGLYHGADGIKGHANLVAVEAQKGTAVVANTAAAAMGVASMVVGQYYMTQINAKLCAISDGISKISDFQNNEYRSRVFSLIAHVKKITDFQVEIIENNELRLSKIARIDSLEEECTQLLGQANLTLAGYAKKKDLDYEAYEKELNEAQNWYLYQKSLLDLLSKISDLRYTLHLGAVSREQCVALLPIYTQQVVDTQARLTNWHQDTAKRLNIDTEESRRKREGLDRIIHFLPGLIKNELNFRTIDKSIANMIDEQVNGNSNGHQQEQTELYLEDVQLIAKDGKVYYLPESKAE
ncbi:MAG: hypothetical protein GX272_01265 [Epulopiscium sp.]|nr:hypothetical protein [Candidatus Epulonipiscium sp.]